MVYLSTVTDKLDPSSEVAGESPAVDTTSVDAVPSGVERRADGGTGTEGAARTDPDSAPERRTDPVLPPAGRGPRSVRPPDSNARRAADAHARDYRPDRARSTGRSASDGARGRVRRDCGRRHHRRRGFRSPDHLRDRLRTPPSPARGDRRRRGSRICSIDSPASTRPACRSSRRLAAFEVDLGPLGPELDRIWNDIQWGADLQTALGRFEGRVGTRSISVVTLLTESMKASGNLETTLRIAARGGGGSTSRARAQAGDGRVHGGRLRLVSGLPVHHRRARRVSNPEPPRPAVRSCPPRPAPESADWVGSLRSVPTPTPCSSTTRPSFRGRSRG